MKHCLNVDCTASCSEKRCRHMDRFNRLISSFLKNFMFTFELGEGGKISAVRG